MFFHLAEACAALLLPSHAGIQRAGLVFGGGPYQLHNWSAVVYAWPNRERSTGFPTDPD